MDRFHFWQRWLMGLGLFLVLFGIGMAFLNDTPLFGPFHTYVDPVFWTDGVQPDGVPPFQRWIYGVLGSAIAGWGVFVYFLARHPFGRRERWAWNCALAGMLVWFLPDTAISLYYRVYFNMGLNATLFLLAVLPLLFTRKHFISGS